MAKLLIHLSTLSSSARALVPDAIADGAETAPTLTY